MAWAPKQTKKEKREKKTSYFLHYAHSTPRDKRSWNGWSDGYITITVIDPAEDNYAIRIERWWNNGFIERLHFEYVYFIDTNPDGTTNLGWQVWNYLSQFHYLFLDCHYIIMEQQVHINHRAVCVSMMTLMYFTMALKDQGKCFDFLELAPKLKYKVMKTPANIDRKAWAGAKADQLFVQRNDIESLFKLRGAKKKDDLGDVTIMGVTVMIHLGLVPAEPFLRPVTGYDDPLAFMK